jgi:hypothetical protein
MCVSGRSDYGQTYDNERDASKSSEISHQS